MKNFFNDVVTVAMLVNENNGMQSYDVDVEIVDRDEINFVLDEKIGTVEYDDGMWLEVYNKDGYVVGFWLDEDEI